MSASPTLYPGQTVRTEFECGEDTADGVHANLYVSIFADPDDRLEILRGEPVALQPGARRTLAWRLPDTGGAPIAQVGLEIHSDQRASGSVYLDYLTWDSVPTVTLTRPAGDKLPARFETTKRMWRRAWVNGIDQYDLRWPEPFRLAQNEGRGLLIQGGRDWTDYEAAATLTLHLAKQAGIAVRVQGMRRYYALLLSGDGKARLVKALDGDTVLAEADYPWQFGTSQDFRLRVTGNRIQASLDGHPLFDVTDSDRPLTGGGVAYVVEEGRVMSDAMTVKP
jgi:hypothetical protein